MVLKAGWSLSESVLKVGRTVTSGDDGGRHPQDLRLGDIELQQLRPLTNFHYGCTEIKHSMAYTSPPTSPHECEAADDGDNYQSG